MTRETLKIVAILLLCGTSFSATAQTAKARNKPSTAPQNYCISTGGVVETRYPVYGTNGATQDWLQLAGREDFCQYTQSSDGSRIHVSLDTLFTTLPTMAALAYYAESPWNGQGEGNPASLYCTQLGGSDLFGGVTGAGGGWVELDTTDVVLEASRQLDHRFLGIVLPFRRHYSRHRSFHGIEIPESLLQNEDRQVRPPYCSLLQAHEIVPPLEAAAALFFSRAASSYGS